MVCPGLACSMLDVLRHPGDRLVWDFRDPALTCRILLKDTRTYMIRMFYKFGGRPQEYEPLRGRLGMDWNLQMRLHKQNWQAAAEFDQWFRSVPRLTLRQRLIAFARTGIRWVWHHLCRAWDSVPFPLKMAGLGYLVWRAIRWRQSYATCVSRTVFDGQDDIAFCACCSPELLDDDLMMLLALGGGF